MDAKQSVLFPQPFFDRQILFLCFLSITHDATIVMVGKRRPSMTTLIYRLVLLLNLIHLSSIARQGTSGCLDPNQRAFVDQKRCFPSLPFSLEPLAPVVARRCGAPTRPTQGRQTTRWGDEEAARWLWAVGAEIDWAACTSAKSRDSDSKTSARRRLHSLPPRCVCVCPSLPPQLASIHPFFGATHLHPPPECRVG